MADDELTIDELAQRSGMTVRNIRAHQSRGLLPPPEVRARTGYYGPAHLERLRTIQAMQAEGFNLKAIQRLLSAGNGSGEQLVSFGQELLGSFGPEQPEFMTEADIEARFGTIDFKALRKAQRLGLLRALGDGRYEVPSPTLLRAGEELVALGIPLDHALAVAEKVERSSRSIAVAFVRLFMDDVVGSAPLAKRTAEDWDRLRVALERLRPLATEAVRAAFQQEMSQAVEQQLQRLLDA
ncbi:MAG TPA: MerR family transcriptional regulator [Solirubrobacteraceae bacterium]|nr:MerR family transcriptional regulator [Solirubrobacteraceae bacterium]